ncbi:MAG: sigma 54-interacting transcriptional regulator, partial [Acidobacteria bacterium]|nr:sigma 54-interacting transcriptional regulator [Acidobacteriota bacterium]
RRLGGRQEITFDVRVIAATNQEPREALQKGRLRDDLYYRLNVFTVALPLLRERKEDIPHLVRHFIREGNRKHQGSVEGLRPEVLERLQNYSWPGNVRELKNLMERAVILSKGRWIELAHLPAYVRNPADDPGLGITVPPGASAAEAEKELILRTLEKTGNNKAAAARQLGLDVKTIRNKLKSYGK